MSQKREEKKTICARRSDGSDRCKTNDTSKTVKLCFGLLLVVLAAAGVYSYFYHIPGGEALAAAPAQEAKMGAAASAVTYPVTTFADGKAHQFKYKTSDGQTIRYFVLKSSDGVVRAAFDACDVCWPQNKGYYQDGDFMVCKNCGRRFQSTKVNVITGGCNPSALERTIQDGKVVIQVKHIEDGKRFFPRGHL